MGEYPLLQTKLYIPPLRSERVSRPRLIERLNVALGTSPPVFARKLALISAPAGFGKTTLVSDWVHATLGVSPPTAIAWLSLDEGDNDPARFLAYLISALRTSGPDQGSIGQGVLSTLLSPQPPPVEAILTSFINEISAIPNRLILVLDDCHLVQAQPIYDALAFLLRHLPSQMHLVMTTREDPPLPLGSLRARGQLTELRATDLRFSLSEAAEFLKQVMGLDLTAEDIAALEARTEGWIAGLQLAALSIQGRQDASSLIKSFTGSHRYVLDYLLEEVLEQQSESVQAFLLQTSVLDRLTGSLCDAVCSVGANVRFGEAEAPSTAGADAVRFDGAEAPNGKAILEMLELANLFIVPLDEERRWYRYHQLFSDLIRQRLDQTHPEWVPALHLRASEWYEQNGFVDEAIEHAMHAEEFEWAAHLMEGSADALWARGEHAKLRRWLIALPLELALCHPQLCIYHAWYLFVSGKQDAAEQSLQTAERAVGSGSDYTPGPEAQECEPLTGPDKRKLEGRVAAVRAFMVSYQGDVPGIIHHASRALECLPEQDGTWRGLSAVVLGDAYGFKGEMTAAYEARLEAVKACKAAGDIYYVLLASLKLAITLRAQGRLQKTLDICQEQIQLANEHGLSHATLVGVFMLIRGEVLAERNDLDGAKAQVDPGLLLAERSVDLAMVGWGYMCLMRILFSTGDLGGIEEFVKKMEASAREAHAPTWIVHQMAAWQARVKLAQGNVEAASHWAGERWPEIGAEPKPLPETDFFLLLDYLMLARVWLAQNRLEGTIGLLEGLLEQAERGGRTTRVIEVLALQALAFHAGSHTTQAIAALERALTLAEPEGFVRTFVDEGPPMARLLNEAAARGIAPGYVRRLLAAFEGATVDKGRGAKGRGPASSSVVQGSLSPLVEPLSERELEILELISEGLTNPEIASRLFLSVNTVKTHTRNIYGKLDVHSRTQAMARAQELGLLPGRDS